MADARATSQWDLVASLSRFSRVLHKANSEQTNVKIDNAPTVDQTARWIPLPSFLALLGRVSRGWIYELIGKISIFPIVIGATIVIANANPPPALAAVEETAGTDDSASDYNQSSFTFDLSDASTSNLVMGSPINVGDVFIPTAVWSLETSTGVHLDHIPAQVGADLGGALGNYRISSDFWTRATGGFWADENTYRTFAETSFSSLLLQVASCGGNSAERSNLDFCNINANSTKRDIDYNEEIKGDNGNRNAIALANPSDSPSDSSQEPQPVYRPDLSLPTPTAQIRGHHVAPIDDPTMSVDDPTPPAGDSITPADDRIARIVDVEETVPPLDPVVPSDPLPIFTPPSQSPIPETSTEVMTIIGFGIMFVAMRWKVGNSIKNRVISALSNIS